MRNIDLDRDALRALLTEWLATRGLHATVAAFGVGRETVLRIVTGQPVRPSTLGLVTLHAERMRAASAAA